MSDYDKLTTEAKACLLTLYKEYKMGVKQGIPRNKARAFEDLPDLHNRLFKSWDEDTLLDVFKELASYKFVQAEWGSNSFGQVQLTSIALSSIKSRFKNGFNELLKALVELKTLLS